MKWKYYKFTTLRKVVDLKYEIERRALFREEINSMISRTLKELYDKEINRLKYSCSRMLKLSEYLYERERRSYKEFAKLSYWGRIKYFLR